MFRYINHLLLLTFFTYLPTTFADDSNYKRRLPAKNLLTEIEVNASLTSTTLKDVTSAISIIDSDQIRRSHKRYIAEHLTSAPNVNFSSGASRGRFFQIRGTGERSQFIDPITPSVGLYVDGIDFSGFGNIANLFDIERIEVLRGPQGTSAGAGASAGLINIVSNNPTSEFRTTLTSGLSAIDGNNGDIDGYHAGLVINGAINDTTNARIGIYQNRSDGFTDNVFLNRDDTSKIDETLVRGKTQWQASDSLTIDSTLLFSEVDNGYDGFTLDNVRQTITDEPGFDRQRTRAISIAPTLRLNEQYSVSLLLTHSDDDIEYGYDEDWTFTGFDINGYTSFDGYFRERKNSTIDLQINSRNKDIEWVVGLYYKDQAVDLQRDYRFDANFNGQYDANEFANFNSEYDTREIATYGEAKFEVSDNLTLTSGLRIEAFDSEYNDSAGENVDPSDTFWGGHISATYLISDLTTIFSRLSKGFKAAGINADSATALPASDKIYNNETLWNIEMGANFNNTSNTLRGQLTAFYQQRDDAQIKQSLVTPIAGTSCPCSFEDYIDNANETQHYGLELETTYNATNSLQISLSAGYLKAEFSDYIRLSEGAGNLEIREDLKGRNVANAPEYQFAFGADWAITNNLSLWTQVEGRDQYFFSNRHDEQSTAYELLNSTLTYATNIWELSLWGKNLANANYHTRGFGSFGNDPRNGYTTEPYYQFGNPREFGVSGTYHFY